MHGLVKYMRGEVGRPNLFMQMLSGIRLHCLEGHSTSQHKETKVWISSWILEVLELDRLTPGYFLLMKLLLKLWLKTS